MKMLFSKQVYDQFDDESRRGLVPVPCDCITEEQPIADTDCESCDGGGVIYEATLSAEDSAAVQENLRSQGVPLGKIGTH